MKTILTAIALFASLVGPAGAYTITVSPLEVSKLTVFDSTQANTGIAPGNFASGGYYFSGTGLIFQSSFPGIAAQPAAPVEHNYMAVLGGGVETITLARASDSIGIYWGSIDPFNSITVNGTQITGSDVMVAGLSDSGDWNSPFSNALITLGSVGLIHSFEISSSQNSFEFNLAPVPTPELSTWAMMLAGFTALAIVGFRRRAPRLGTL